MKTVSLLIASLLFGGMVLYSFGFAAFLFTALPSPLAGQTLRRAFPHFYLFVLITSAIASVVIWPHDSLAGILLASIALTTWPTRQILMPAINRATDAKAVKRFKLLHGLSVLVSLIHILLAGLVVARFA